MKNLMYYLKQTYYLIIIFVGIGLTGIISYNIIKDNGLNVISILLFAIPFLINGFVVFYYIKLFISNKKNKINNNDKKEVYGSYLSDVVKLLKKHGNSEFSDISNKYIESSLASLDYLRKKYGDQWENKCHIEMINDRLNKIKYSDTQLYEDCVNAESIIKNIENKIDSKINKML